MLKVTKKMEYALMALKFMVQKDQETAAPELTSAREVCDHFNTPFDTTARVMQVMNNHKILNSIKGVKGGYTLAVNLNEITYYELHNLIEGINESPCISHRGLCDLHSECNIVGPMEALNAKLNEYLTTLSIQELLFGKQTPSQIVSSAIMGGIDLSREEKK